MTAQYRVLLTDRAWPDWNLEREILAAVDAEVIDAPNGDEATLIALARDADAIGTCWAQVTADVIRAATTCRVIARFGIGLDNICVKTATERGIPVTNVPDYCVTEVAEHTLALLLACARKVAFYHLQTKQGRYQLQAGPPLERLEGQTLGLIGLGQIGKVVSQKAAALGLNVTAHTRSGNDLQTGCRMLSLEELLNQSDYISLHVPLTDQTRHMLGPPQFEQMKSTAYLINTSRGAIVDHGALKEALDRGAIAGAALDVFDPEPPELSEPLFQDERVIVTPHAAFLSGTSLLELRRRAAGQVAHVLQGLRPEHVVNSQVFGESK